jgi:hypothetical protein
MNGEPMKWKVYCLLISILITVPILNGCAARRASFRGDRDEFFGTFVNLDVEGDIFFPQKLVNRTDGIWLEFTRSTLPYPSLTGSFTITDKWFDAGNIWYRYIWINELQLRGYGLVRISDRGRTYERMWAYYGYPDAIVPPEPDAVQDPSTGVYNIYYRAKRSRD